MNFKTAEFSCRKVEDPRAILVMVPGSNDDGRDIIYQAAVKDWCDNNNVAAVGTFFEDIDPSQIEGYADAKGGSGAALLAYIDAKFQQKDLPLLLWGFSAGGQFNHEFACAYPERVAGYVVNKGGFYYTALAPPQTRQIPALYFVGLRDAEFRQNILKGIVGMNRKDHKCRWELVFEDVGHSVGYSFVRSMNFFSDILNQK